MVNQKLFWTLSKNSEIIVNSKFLIKKLNKMTYSLSQKNVVKKYKSFEELQKSEL